MLRMRITYSQRSMLLEVGSSGIPQSNNHGIWHSELQLMIRRQIRMQNFQEIEIYQLGQVQLKEVHMHQLHILTLTFKEQEMQININTSNIKINTLNGIIFISLTIDQRDKLTVQYGSKIEKRKRHLIKSITSWHHIIEYLLEKINSIQLIMAMLQISNSFFVKMPSIQHSSQVMNQNYQRSQLLK